jgi:transposase
MAKERIEMGKILEILRLFYEEKLSVRQISMATEVSKTAVSKYINATAAVGIEWPLPEGYDISTIEKLLSQSKEESSSKPMPDFPTIFLDLKKKGVTLSLLWAEYKTDHPDGYQFTQFCELFHRWEKSNDVSMLQNHKAGEKMFVDYAGKGITITDKDTGETWEAPIFVAVQGASSYAFANAYKSQCLEEWIAANIDSFEFFEGVPEIVVPDNLRSAISKSSRYEPVINRTYAAMARHYGTVIVPARVREPQDKAKVESGVQVVTMWITAALRNHTFFSLEEANREIRKKLDELNARKFQKLNTSRKEQFEQLDKPALRPLPSTRYEYAEWEVQTVRNDYHVFVREHYYSVPHELSGKKVDVRLTQQIVEILYKGNRVATHERSTDIGKATTIKEHMPRSHRAFADWNRSTIVEKAKSIGPNTGAFVEMTMSQSQHEEVAKRICSGVINLVKGYGTERLEAATARALKIKSYRFSSVLSILQSGLDKVPLEEDGIKDPGIEHENIRGKQYYR